VSRKEQTWDGQKLGLESAADSYGTVRMPLLGAHQLANAAVAVAALEEFARISSINVSGAAVKNGLASVSWPGRLQVIARDPVTVLDGAHNPEAAAALNLALRELSGGRPLSLILGMCADKDAAGFIRNLTVPVSRCWAVGLANERSLPPAELARHARNAGWPCSTAALPRALAEAGRTAREQDGIVCAAGSLFLAGEILTLRKAPEA
jgi:dihydrofolate synthase/folylpolyglutamate synthase